MGQWHLIKDHKRQLPCHPSIKIRVKVIEPGVQSRWCDRCGVFRYFALRPLAEVDALKLYWLTDGETAEYLASISEPPPEWLG